MTNQVIITKVANGFMVEALDGDTNPTYVATSVKDSYSYGNVSLVKVLDEIFNPVVPTTEFTE